MSVSKTRQKLVDVARQLFAKNGIANTTMNDIAVASGKGRRTLYTYFNRKEDVYSAVIESELERLSDKLDEVAAMKIRPQDKIIKLIYTHLSMIRETVVRNGNLRAEFFRNIWMVEKVRKNFDILVNNAGITKDGLMMRMTETQWDAVIAVNLKSAFNFIHACTPIMVRQKSGSIINMASVVGVHGNAGQSNYAASKAGLIALAKSIGQEVGSRGIRANAIAPGFIDTAMTQALPDNIRAEWIKKIPLRRGGTVEDIANVATFLASDMSSYVTGQVIQVDGGMNM